MMKRKLFVISLASSLAFATPLAAQASSFETVAVEQADEQAEVSVDGQTAYVTGAVGQELVVVSLTGRQLLKVRIDSPAQRIELNIPKGCYILKVGKVVRKIQVR